MRTKFGHSLIWYVILNLFFSGESRISKTQQRVCPPRLLLMSKHPVGEETGSEQHLVKEERVHKIVHYDKTERLL